MKILVVDDEIRVVEQLKAFLERRSHSVDIAFDGEEALKLIQQNKYEVMLLDEDLPGKMAGLEIVEYVKKHNIRAKTVIITGYPDIDEKFSKRVGADEFLQKPLNLEKIEGVINKYKTA